MCTVLSVCVSLCAKHCQYIQLYVPSAVSMCNCMYQVLSVRPQVLPMLLEVSNTKNIVLSPFFPLYLFSFFFLIFLAT